MTDLTRRSFTALAGASMVPLFAPAVLGQAKAKPKLVVIGEQGDIDERAIRAGLGV